MASRLLWLIVSLCLSISSRGSCSRIEPSVEFWPSQAIWPTPEIQPTSGTNQQTTCSALQGIVSTNPLCTTSISCTAINCILSDENTAMFGVMPCSNPPSINVVTRQNGRVVFNNTISQSRVIPITLSGITIVRINVTVTHSPDLDSITLKVDAIFTLSTTTALPLIPETRIPIDRSQCNSTETHVSQLLSLYPSPTPTGPSPHVQTCQTLRRIASTPGSVCHTTDSCTALDCVYISYHSKLTILPCNNPPALRVAITNPSGTIVFNQTLTQSRRQPVSFGNIIFYVVFTISHTPNSINLKVTLDPPIGSDIVLVPKTSIPIDRSNCSNVFPMISVTPTPTPALATSRTCQALQQISSSTQGCQITSSCNTLVCDLVAATVDFTVLPCVTPPAVQVVVLDGSDEVLFNDTVTRSRLENITLGSTPVFLLNVTVRHPPSMDAIIFKVDLIIISGGSVLPIINETRIPIDRCSCPNIHCSTVLIPSSMPTRSTSNYVKHATTTFTQSPGNHVGPMTTTVGNHVGPMPTNHVGPMPTNHVGPMPTNHVGPMPTNHVGPMPTNHVGPMPTNHVGPMPTSSVVSTNATTSTVSVTKQPSSVLPKIVVPVVLVVLLLLVGSVVLIVGVVYLRKKRARTFTFQRMALSDVEGEEEDDD